MAQVPPKLRRPDLRYAEGNTEKMIFTVSDDKWVESMGDGEVVRSHLGLKQVWLRGHTIDVSFHDGFCEIFVVQGSIVGVLVEENSELVFAEVAAELIQATFEGSEVSVAGITKIEVR